MDLRSLAVGAKVRIAVFFLMTGYLVFGGVASVHGFRELQLGQLTKDAANADVTIDGADFSLFFIAGAGLIDLFVTVLSAVGYTLVMAVLGVVSAFLLRAVGLRKSWEVSPTEPKLCTAGYAAFVAIGLIVSLIITKGGLLLAVVLFELPSAGLMWLIYLRELKRRSLTSKQGHFIEGTEQDLFDV